MLLLLSLAVALTPEELHAIDDSFTPSWTTAGMTLEKRGEATLRRGLIFRVYRAAFYLPPQVTAEEALTDVPKRLEICYYRDIRAELFVRAGNELLAENIDAATYEALQPRLDQINALYDDVRKGDRYALTYLPGVGTTLELNGKPLGTIEGADFAAAYFTIWLGTSEVKKTLRDELLDL